MTKNSFFILFCFSAKLLKIMLQFNMLFFNVYVCILQNVFYFIDIHRDNIIKDVYRTNFTQPLEWPCR